MNFQTYLTLMIEGFPCDPAEISNILRLTPKKVWKIGDPQLENALDTVKYINRWAFNLPEDPINLEMDAAVFKFRNLLGDNLSRFRDLPVEATVRVTLSVYAYKYMPALSVSHEGIQFLAAIRAGLDFDPYNLTGEE